MVMSYHTGAGNQNQVLWESSLCSQPLNHLPSLCWGFSNKSCHLQNVKSHPSNQWDFIEITNFHFLPGSDQQLKCQRALKEEFVNSGSSPTSWDSLAASNGESPFQLFCVHYHTSHLSTVSDFGSSGLTSFSQAAILSGYCNVARKSPPFLHRYQIPYIVFYSSTSFKSYLGIAKYL